MRNWLRLWKWHHFVYLQRKYKLPEKEAYSKANTFKGFLLWFSSIRINWHVFSDALKYSKENLIYSNFLEKIK